jgi:hypothetical protein
VESSSGGRVRVACDACDAGAWIGPRPASGSGTDAWCEACQRAEHLAEGAAPKCPACGGPLATSAPRFPGLWGELQHLEAVLAAWTGDPKPLRALLPERPRFMTDLAPPATRDGDDAVTVGALSAAARGDWTAVLSAPASAEPRSLAARAIAHERGGNATAAIADWSRVIESGEWPQARLARGVLHAKAGGYEAAAGDFALAGDGREARWNRAALRVYHAVSSTPGMPDVREIDAARSEAGPASAYWSEPTVGRLAFTLLTERALARREAGEFGDLDVVALRKGEDLLEHHSFWDRALVLVAHARLDNEGDATRVARPLARELAAALLAEPALKGAALAGAREAVTRAWDAISAFEPRAALEAIQPLLSHDALKRYRIPCSACGRGTLGADAWDEARVADAHGAG